MSESNDQATSPFPGPNPRPPFPQQQPRFGSSSSSSGVDVPVTQSVPSSAAQSPSSYELRDVQQQLLSTSIAAAMIDAQFQQHHHHLPHQHLQAQLAARLHQRFAAAVGAGIPFNQQVAACGLLRASSSGHAGLAGPPGSSGSVAAAAGVVSAGHLLSYLYARQQQQQHQQQHRPINHHEHVNSRTTAAHSGVSPAFLGGPGTGCHQLDEPKPTHSYIGIIAMAILGSKDRKLVLSDIYQWILDHYPYFRRRGPGWRNSIRHNLSLNDCFVKVGRSANGKGHYWAVHPANIDDFERGDFRRRRAQRKVRRAMGLSVPDDDEDSPVSSPSVPVDHGPASVTGVWPTSIFDCAPTSHVDDNQTHRWKQRRFVDGKHDVVITSTKVVSNDRSSPLPVPFTESANGGRKRRLFDVESLLAPDVIDGKQKSPRREVFFIENAIYQRENQLNQRYSNVDAFNGLLSRAQFTANDSLNPNVADRPSSCCSSQDETGRTINASSPRRSVVRISDVVEQTKLIDDESTEISVEENGGTIEDESIENAAATGVSGRMMEASNRTDSIAMNAARSRQKTTTSDAATIDLMVTSPVDRIPHPVLSPTVRRDDVESKYEQYCRSRDQHHEMLVRNHQSMTAAAAWIAHLKGSFFDPRTLLFPSHAPLQSSVPVDEQLPVNGRRDDRRSASSIDDVIADGVVALGTDRLGSFADQRSSIASIKTETV